MRPLRYLMLLECLLFGSLALPQSNIPSLDARDTSPSVSLEQGTIVGTATIVNAASPTVHKFLGVPFAESPPKRFAPSEPVKKSKDTILAQKWSPKCIENAMPGTLVDDAEQSEDCLYLNVYVPNTATRNKAVMFWIYGGNLQFGNAGQPNYDGSYFAASQDVIVVSANYRTNAFGFSNSPEIPIKERNSGFLDQRLALQWVQQNIEAFGGDPEKVTIFGESSGASSVDRLLTAPPSPLPYRAAILQSGQASVSVASGGDGPASWRSLVKLLGCNGSTSELDCVRKADALKIRSLVMDKGLIFTPVNDGVTQLATPQIISRSFGHAAPVPMLIGSNGLEASLFLQPVFKELYESKSANATYEALAATLGDQAAAFIRKEVVSKTSKGAVALFYALSQIASDILYKCPASLVSKASASAGNPTWRYLFNGTFPNTQAPLILPEYGLTSVGAFHSSEIPIVFGTYGEFDKYAPSTADEIALKSANLREIVDIRPFYRPSPLSSETTIVWSFAEAYKTFMASRFDGTERWYINDAANYGKTKLIEKLTSDLAAASNVAAADDQQWQARIGTWNARGTILGTVTFFKQSRTSFKSSCKYFSNGKLGHSIGQRPGWLTAAPTLTDRISPTISTPDGYSCTKTVTEIMCNLVTGRHGPAFVTHIRCNSWANTRTTDKKPSPSPTLASPKFSENTLRCNKSGQAPNPNAITYAAQSFLRDLVVKNQDNGYYWSNDRLEGKKVPLTGLLPA
ncbi:para-nitrobenzyl esterase [Fusarium pseudocircinatum]|uniref:Para-nitrobenzyl esterase n=1 Tax=Fusarium pseudocircinatum TaxID=56676 RepID=A0A8H5L0B1_9HYPO|nr:para-nitrobenzyl esterase [Fusarium pseudocircinatum]